MESLIDRWKFAALLVAVVAAGCGGQTDNVPPEATSSSSADSKPPVASRIDPRWMGLGTSDLWNWELVDRRITHDFHQFGVRPDNETKLPRNCNGCGEHPATAIITVFNPGEFDPADARTGRPVDVDGRDGFFRASQGTEDAVLAWQYEDGAWATVHGRTETTSELDVMIALAGDLRPDERTPVRLALSFAEMPSGMPLSSITDQHGPWPTRVHFDACQRDGYRRPAPDCTDGDDVLSVLIWPTDGFSGHFSEEGAVPITIGGKDGLINRAHREAAVQVGPGKLVVFQLSGPYETPPKPPINDLEDILTAVTWAPDPANEQTWPEVTDWVQS